MHQEFDEAQLTEWLNLLGGPGWQGQEACDRALKEMRKVGASKLFPSLLPRLNHHNIDVRCKASRAILGIDAKEGIELLLPFFDDPNVTFRWDICGLMHEYGDERVIEPLINRMKNDPDPQVRGTAAYALGGIGNPAAIPALTETLNHDHEIDQLGYTPSHGAESAINEIQRKSQKA
jgi:HEAT repeat protein